MPTKVLVTDDEPLGNVTVEVVRTKQAENTMSLAPVVSVVVSVAAVPLVLVPENVPVGLV